MFVMKRELNMILSPDEIYLSLCETLQEFEMCITQENALMQAYDFSQMQETIDRKTAISATYQSLLAAFKRHQIVQQLSADQKEILKSKGDSLAQAMKENIELLDAAMAHNQTMVQLFVNTAQQMQCKGYTAAGKENHIKVGAAIAIDQQM